MDNRMARKSLFQSLRNEKHARTRRPGRCRIGSQSVPEASVATCSQCSQGGPPQARLRMRRDRFRDSRPGAVARCSQRNQPSRLRRDSGHGSRARLRWLQNPVVTDSQSAHDSASSTRTCPGGRHSEDAEVVSYRLLGEHLRAGFGGYAVTRPRAAEQSRGAVRLGRARSRSSRKILRRTPTTATASYAATQTGQ